MSVANQCHGANLPSGNPGLPTQVHNWLSPPAQFSLVAERIERRELERYIAERFHREYSATVTEFMPHLVRMSCCGKTSAAVGVRCAGEGRLFVEQYLDQPLENVLASLNHAVPRTRIVELGNLVASHRGASRLLFLTIANSLWLADIDWLVFAATRQVAKLVAKFPCDTVYLGAADPARLGDNVHKWGSYYATDPQVIAMYLPLARRQIERSAMATLQMRLYRDTSKNLARQLKAAMQSALPSC